MKSQQVRLSESTNIGRCFCKRNTPKFNQQRVLQRLGICDDAKTSATPKILRICPKQCLECSKETGMPDAKLPPNDVHLQRPVVYFVETTDFN